MMHVAMFEAVNAIERRYTPYKLNLTADRTASKEAAAATAGYEVLLALYPDQKAEPGYDVGCRSSRTFRTTRPRPKGIALGKKAAAEIIALRANDGSRRAGDVPADHRARRLCADAGSGRVQPSAGSSRG